MYLTLSVLYQICLQKTIFRREQNENDDQRKAGLVDRADKDY